MSLSFKEFQLRIANLEDAERVAFINSQSWQTTYRGIIDPEFLKTVTPEQQLPRAKRLVSSRDLITVVVEDRGSSSIVGFAVFGDNRDLKIDADCELQAIYLLESFHRRGIGQRLFDFGVQALRKKSKKKMSVSVFKDNLLACGFYEKTGAYKRQRDRISLAGRNYETISYVWDLEKF